MCVCVSVRVLICIHGRDFIIYLTVILISWLCDTRYIINDDCVYSDHTSHKTYTILSRTGLCRLNTKTFDVILFQYLGLWIPYE